MELELELGVGSGDTQCDIDEEAVADLLPLMTSEGAVVPAVSIL